MNLTNQKNIYFNNIEKLNLSIQKKNEFKSIINEIFDVTDFNNSKLKDLEKYFEDNLSDDGIQLLDTEYNNLENIIGM